MNNIVTICYVMCFLIIECQLIKVSPKLDFVQSKEETTKTKVAPKIQGVRVVVDTTNTKIKKSVESQSDEEEEDNDSDNSSKSVGKKKTVGIRTDITFEISDDDDDTTNSTKTNKKNKDPESRSDDDDNSGPPIIKGNAGTSGKEGSNDRKWNTHNIPVFHGTDDESPQHGGTGDHWSNFIPPVTSVWTTERSRFYPARDQGFRANSRPQVQNPWKPCLCSSSDPSWRPNDYARRSYVVPLTERSISVDDKLEYPFSSEEFKGK